MKNITSSFTIEETRIREAYAKRKKGKKGRYSWFNPGNLYMVQERERLLLSLFKRRGLTQLDGKTILEIGCGAGYWLHEFMKWGIRPENVYGIDLLSDRVAAAKRLFPDAVTIDCMSADKLVFTDNSFDIVLQSTVFSSILDVNLKQRIAQQMFRVVKRNGLIIWYDFHWNNPWNADVRGVKKEEIFNLFPSSTIELWPTTLCPPLVRSLAPYSWTACHLLERLKVFNSHYLGFIRKT